VWCRRTDELVDGPNSSHITPGALDRWEQRLTDVFEGRPYDMYDAALSHTVSKYPVDIQVLTSHAKSKIQLYTIFGLNLFCSYFLCYSSVKNCFVLVIYEYPDEMI